VEALYRHPPPGPAPRLTPEQRTELVALLAQGAEAPGFLGRLWTTKRVAALIQATFRVRYHPAHVSRLLRALPWTVQKPPRRATQRDEAAIAAWLAESDFYLLPAAVRTNAPRGETPVLRVPLTRAHLSAISAITPAGRILVQVQERALRGPDVVRFLPHLLRHIPGKVLVIWDGSPIPRAQVVKAFLAQGAAKRVQLEPLPAYAPELNPDEGLWQYLKHRELRNVCCHSLSELRDELRLAVARVRHKLAVIRAWIRHCGYSL
jgi:transposase